MDFFINSGWAQFGGEGSLFCQFIPLIIIFVLFYFLLIRPQSKRAKEHKKMVDELEEGQEVVTGGGVLGRVIAVRDNWVTIEVSNSVSVKVQRGTISVVVPAGTIKNS